MKLLLVLWETRKHLSFFAFWRFCRDSRENTVVGFGIPIARFFFYPCQVPVVLLMPVCFCFSSGFQLEKVLRLGFFVF